LCFRHFERVQPFFMYYVPNMEFQERTVRRYEAKYGVEIIRIPHFETSNFLRYGTYRDADFTVPIVSVSEIYDYLRIKTGIHWIACGERIADSMVRRAMIKHSGSIDEKRGRFYPVCYWNKQDVINYIKHKKLYLPDEYAKIGHSFRSLSDEDVSFVKRYYPNDYQKLLRVYPLAAAAAYRAENYGARE